MALFVGSIIDTTIVFAVWSTPKIVAVKDTLKMARNKIHVAGVNGIPGNVKAYICATAEPLPTSRLAAVIEIHIRCFYTSC